MTDSITLKPVLWRLTIWKFVPFYIGWSGASLIFDGFNHYPKPLQFFLGMAGLGFVITMILVFFMRKRFDIVLSEGKISGLAVAGWGLNSETFAVVEFDKSSFDRQTLYEKISGYYSLRSLDGKRIMFAPFIYGNQAAKKLRSVLLDPRREPNIGERRASA